MKTVQSAIQFNFSVYSLLLECINHSTILRKRVGTYIGRCITDCDRTSKVIWTPPSFAQPPILPYPTFSSLEKRPVMKHRAIHEQCVPIKKYRRGCHQVCEQLGWTPQPHRKILQLAIGPVQSGPGILRLETETHLFHSRGHWPSHPEFLMAATLVAVNVVLVARNRYSTIPAVNIYDVAQLIYEETSDLVIKRLLVFVN